MTQSAKSRLPISRSENKALVVPRNPGWSSFITALLYNKPWEIRAFSFALGHLEHIGALLCEPWGCLLGRGNQSKLTMRLHGVSKFAAVSRIGKWSCGVRSAKWHASTYKLQESLWLLGGTTFHITIKFSTNDEFIGDEAQ